MPLVRSSLVLGLALAGLGLTACDDQLGAGPVDELAAHPSLDPETFDQTELSTPPAVTGGTLAITPNGQRAIAADPDRGAVHVVELPSGAVRAVIRADQEPGRVVISADSRTAYVALRAGGAVLVVDALIGRAVGRIATCPSPRGLALDAEDSRLHVACLGGKLITHDTTDHSRVRTVEVAPDLRDVIVDGDELLVSQFRASRLHRIDAQGRVVATHGPQLERTHVPSVAWRTVKAANGHIYMLHQAARPAVTRARPVPRPGQPPQPAYYAPAPVCGGGLYTTAVTELDRHGEVVETTFFEQAVLAVDLAVDDERYVLVAPGAVPSAAPGGLRSVMARPLGVESPLCFTDAASLGEGSFSSVAVGPGGTIYLFRNTDPALMTLNGGLVAELPGPVNDDIGHNLFHVSQGTGLACASCHPEGSDDGIVWDFSDIGLRRTQDIRGGISNTAPFHWEQDIHDLRDLVVEVMVGRMGGDMPLLSDIEEMGHWMDALHVPRVEPIGGGDAEAGAQIFNDPMVGCAGCHNGPRYSDGIAYDIGKGVVLETGTLIGISRRPRLMHDGCANSLAERFDPACGGVSHGRTEHLTGHQLDDLIAFLRTL